MSYNETLADRIRQVLREKKIPFEEKKMMGGLCFMVNDKMCGGIHFDKKKNIDLLMARIGQENTQTHTRRAGVLPMNITGRPMKDFIFVRPVGFETDEDLAYWIQLCLDFNPFAKRSKKKASPEK